MLNIANFTAVWSISVLFPSYLSLISSSSVCCLWFPLSISLQHLQGQNLTFLTGLTYIYIFPGFHLLFLLFYFQCLLLSIFFCVIYLFVSFYLLSTIFCIINSLFLFCVTECDQFWFLFSSAVLNYWIYCNVWGNPPPVTVLNNFWTTW